MFGGAALDRIPLVCTQLYLGEINDAEELTCRPVGRGLWRTARRGPAQDQSLPLAQAVLAVFAQRRQQVADNAAFAGFDLGGDRHAGCQVNHPVFDLHLGAVE